MNDWEIWKTAPQRSRSQVCLLLYTLSIETDAPWRAGFAAGISVLEPETAYVLEGKKSEAARVLLCGSCTVTLP